MKNALFGVLLLTAACSGGTEGEDVVADAALPADSMPVPDAAPVPDADPALPDATPPPPIVVNEVFAGGAPTNPLFAADWFEIKNLGTVDLDLGGYHATDDPAALTKGTFAAGTIVPAGGYLKVDLDVEPLAFSLKQAGSEPLILVAPDGTTIIDNVSFADGAAGADATTVTWGRFPDGSGAFKTLTTATPGAANVDN